MRLCGGESEPRRSSAGGGDAKPILASAAPNPISSCYLNWSWAWRSKRSQSCWAGRLLRSAGPCHLRFIIGPDRALCYDQYLCMLNEGLCTGSAVSSCLRPYRLSARFRYLALARFAVMRSTGCCRNTFYGGCLLDGTLPCPSNTVLSLQLSARRRL